jgi:hypothetical protein
MYVDQNNDKTFRVLASLMEERPGLGELVKTAEVGEEARSALPTHSFADPSERRYPVHTAANAVLSKAYAIKQANVSAEVHSAIDTALSLFGAVLPSVLTTKVASAAPPVYLLPDTQQLPIRDAGDIKLAEEALHRATRKLKPTTISRAAATLIKQAERYGVEVSGATLVHAGLTQCDRDKTADYLEARSAAAPSAATEFDKLAEAIRGAAMGVDRDDLIKVAQAVSTLDVEHGLTEYYGRSLPNPLETVFSTKVAMGTSLDLAGAQASTEQLLQMSPDEYGDVLGPDFQDEITGDGGEIDEQSLLVTLETLPLDMKKALRKHLGL